MNTQNKSAVQWLWVVGMIILLGACTAPVRNNVPVTALSTATPTAVPTLQPMLRLENGAIQVQDENQDWVPVGGETTFELAGTLESTDPWMVTGNTFATRESTQVAEELEPGDPVLVKGIILEDATWLANSIERTEEQSDPALTLIGKVNSTDPWMINGIKLDVTSDTVISGEVKPETVVRVDVLLQEDGSWEVVNIAPLDEFTEIPGCATVRARIESVNGNEVQFADWPVVTLGEDVKIEDKAGKEATLAVNQSVLVLVCHSEGDQFRITKIVVLESDGDGDAANGEKVLICHKPEKKGGHTLSIAAAAVQAHLAHGDKMGACPGSNTNK